MDPGAEHYRRFLDGDKNAMGELIRLYKDGLIFYLTGFTKDPGLAEELTQETFVRLYVRRPRFAGKSSFGTWLYAIGRNLAISYLRREKKRAPLPPDEALPPDMAADPAGICLRDERRRRLSAALETLPADYRQALRLRYFEERSVRETAREMRRSEPAARVLLYRARQALKRELEKEGISDEDL